MKYFFLLEDPFKYSPQSGFPAPPLFLELCFQYIFVSHRSLIAVISQCTANIIWEELRSPISQGRFVIISILHKLARKQEENKQAHKLIKVKVIILENSKWKWTICEKIAIVYFKFGIAVFWIRDLG